MSALRLIIPVLAGTLLPLAAEAGPLTEARVTKIINSVQVVDPVKGAHSASLQETIKDAIELKTGVKSRSELLFQDNTLTRIGPETVFSFKAGTREMSLDRGTMLLQVPKGLGGAKIRTAAVTAAITGTTIMMEYRPGRDLKVLVLEGSLRLSLNGRLGEQISLRPGQMIMMPPNAKKLPAPVHVDLKRIMSSSSLVNMSKKGAPVLPSLPLIEKAIEEQAIEKGNDTLVATNLSIEGKGTDVIVGSDSTLAAVSRRDDATTSEKPAPVAAATPAPTPITGASPVTTPNPSPSATPLATATPQPSATPLATATPQPSATPLPTVTPNPTATPIATATPKATATPVPSATPKATPKTTPQPTATPRDDDDHGGGDDDHKPGKKKGPDNVPEPGSPDGEVGSNPTVVAESQAPASAKSGARISRVRAADPDRVIHARSSDQLISLMEISADSSDGKVHVSVPAGRNGTNSSNSNLPAKNGTEPTRLPGTNRFTDITADAPEVRRSGVSP